MPYTPPHKQGQAPASPEYSNQSTPPQTPAERPNLPRSASASYLQRYRRSPSFQSHNASHQAESTSSAVMDGSSSSLGNNPSVRQSPPPVGGSNGMPAGAIMSPPDSSQNSDDDEDRGRIRELQEAVRRSFTVDRSSSPNGEAEASTREAPVNGAEQDGKGQSQPPTPPRLTTSARKISHSRSTTEGSIFNQPYELAQQSTSDSSDEESAATSKPPLLRKKSGELVKPAIRPPSRRKHSSMPGTPTYSKAVHFNDDIEQVRHFLQVDRPIAVSAGTSPVNGLEDETEFPFGFQSSDGTDWEIILQNFPRTTFERSTQAIRLEKLFLSPDQKSLIGVAAAANIAFHKHVVARFTFDYWKTTSETCAEYNNDTRQKPREDGYDQFNFNIKLSDQANLESKTLFLCVRYAVGGQVHWDNNGSSNFQVDFAKRAAKAPQKKPEAKSAMSQLGARPLPRSRHNSSSAQRPRSMPSFEDDFVNSLDRGSLPKFRQPPAGHKYSTSDSTPRGNATGQFGSRYDFGASLSAALSQAQAQINHTDSNTSTTKSIPTGPPPNGVAALTRKGISPPNNSGTESPRLDTLLANNKSLDSRAYQDFVSKFCFFGSGNGKSNPSSSGSKGLSGTGGDGADDDDIANDYAPAMSPGSLHRVASASYSGGESNLQPPAARVPSPNGSGTSTPLAVTGTPIGHGASSPGSYGFPFGQDPHSNPTTTIRG